MSEAPVTMMPADIVDLRQMGADQYQALSGGRNTIGSVYGGQVIAQALLAACHTADAMPLTGFHAYFLAAGRIGEPIDYHVTRLRDSRRFANRQVNAFQQGRMIFTLMCEFHTPEDSFTHQHAVMPDVPPPEAVLSLQDYVQQQGDRLEAIARHNFSGPLPIELRPVAPDDFFFQRSERSRSYWFRLPGAAHIDDPRLHQCLLAYAADYWLAGVVAIPHEFPTNNPRLKMASLDHSMWLHRAHRCDAWMLYHTSSPSAGDGIGLAHGSIFDRDGRLIATAMQESLLRRLDTSAG